MRKYRVIDLFSGCGGISKGFLNTGKVEMIGAIDFEKSACDTYEQNFPGAKVICGDIRDITVESTGFSDIDIMVGGPPCQGFSALNRWEKEKDDGKKEFGNGVFNGEIGTITKVDEREKVVEIRFDDDKEAWYEFSELDQIEHSYAITIHKAQRK